MPVSKLDTAYRSLVISKFFTKGWGKPENLKRIFEFRKIISNRETCYELVSKNYPVTITKEVESSNNVLIEGHFLTPFSQHLPGLVPKVSENAYFQVLLPKKWDAEYFKPVCLHLAGTGDHYFFRRRNLMAKPLLKSGIGAILLENPFYGFRKPKGQTWSCLHNVSDIFVMGGCLVLESLVLFHWCKRNGLGPFGVTGISMGGHMASLAATAWPEPLVLVPCLSWSTASGVFTRGVMSSAIDWKQLEEQYFSDEIYNKELKQMVKIINYDTFKAGQHFAKHYPESLNHIQKISTDEDIKTPPNSTVQEPQSPEKNKSNPDMSEDKDAVLREVLIESETTQFLKNLKKENAASTDDTVAPSENNPNFFKPYLSWKKSNDNEKENLDKVDSKEIVNKASGAVVAAAATTGTNTNNERESKPIVVKGKKVVDEVQKKEAIQFMCGIMDECTHLTNFSTPVDTELIIAIIAKDDAYVPTDGTDLREVWPGSQIRYVNSGHVGAFLLHQKTFRVAIVEAFEKLKGKYYSNKTAEKSGDKDVQQSGNR